MREGTRFCLADTPTLYPPEDHAHSGLDAESHRYQTDRSRDHPGLLCLYRNENPSLLCKSSFPQVRDLISKVLLFFLRFVAVGGCSSRGLDQQMQDELLKKRLIPSFSGDSMYRVLPSDGQTLFIVIPINHGRRRLEVELARQVRPVRIALGRDRANLLLIGPTLASISGHHLVTIILRNTSNLEKVFSETNKRLL